MSAIIDPEIADVLSSASLGSSDWSKFTCADVPRLRAGMPALPNLTAPRTDVMCRSFRAPNPTGGPDISLRVFTPRTVNEAWPCLYWIYGGGYIFGPYPEHDARLQRWAAELECAVVAVDYRLAPEDPFPAAFDDCYGGLQWTYRHADQLGLDPHRIVVGGESAGGGLAASVAACARDLDEVAVSYQLLVYPMLDDRDDSPASKMTDAPVWSPSACALAWRAYLNADPGSTGISQYAAAARVRDLTGLPPAFIGVGDADILRDQDIAYASRLLAAGVPTELHVYPGAPHAFELVAPHATVSRRFQRDMDDALRRAFGRAA